MTPKKYNIFTRARIIELAKEGLGYMRIYKRLIAEGCEGPFSMPGIATIIRDVKKKEKANEH